LTFLKVFQVAIRCLRCTAHKKQCTWMCIREIWHLQKHAAKGDKEITFPLLQKNTFHYDSSCTSLKTTLLGPNCCSNAILAEFQVCSSDTSSNCVASRPPSSSITK
jgi:hypothetical protein